MSKRRSAGGAHTTIKPKRVKKSCLKGVSALSTFYAAAATKCQLCHATGDDMKDPINLPCGPGEFFQARDVCFMVTLCAAPKEHGPFCAACLKTHLARPESTTCPMAACRVQYAAGPTPQPVRLWECRICREYALPPVQSKPPCGPASCPMHDLDCC
jgi:hypothetical protein